ncbi:MAG: hydroxymethylbilane synthase [Halobacteriales archaeon]
MSTRRTIRLATRGSDLARRQAAAVAEALEERRYDVELIEVETRGDQVRDELIHRLGKTGAFVRSLDEEVLEGEVDGAVHSMKDMPTDSPPELVVAGIPERATPADLLVTPEGRELPDLDPGAVVGTSSLRRRAQVLSARPDLEVEPLRGNVDTRIEKLLAPGLQREHERRLDAEEDDSETNGDDPETFDRTVEEWFDALSEIERRAMERQPDVEYDAIVLAAAGLERAGLRHHVGDQELPTASFVPSPGQGAIAVTAGEGGEASEIINDAIDHPRTRVETTVERVVLSELGGGCVAPIGVYAVVQGEHVHAEAAVFDRAGEEAVSETRDLPVEEYVPAAREFAADLRERGAADLIAEARADAEEREAKRG